MVDQIVDVSFPMKRLFFERRTDRILRSSGQRKLPQGFRSRGKPRGVQSTLANSCQENLVGVKPVSHAKRVRSRFL